MDSVLARVIRRLKEAQEDISVGLAMRPREDHFAYGLEAGRYQGIEKALAVIDEVLNDEDLKEKRS